MNGSKVKNIIFITGLKTGVKLLISGIVLLLSSANAMAQGDLLISPLRIIFEGSKKSQEISLANVGKDSATYAVSIKDIRMKEDGTFEEITEPDSGQLFAGPFLRFFPRKVTLAPNESQVVKVQLMKTSQMVPGEYRSHLYFRAVPDERPLGDQSAKKDTGGISIQLKPIFGITIPVIIRNGENTAAVTVSDLSFSMSEDKKVTIGLTFNRTGNMSVYGDLKVNYLSNDGKTTELKLVKGIGVYTPNNIRRFKLEIEPASNINFHKGKLQVVYTLATNDKQAKVVEAALELK
ncbi:MAG: fimbria/pilus periplasmic chaperone [Taibaiella sp.]|nr:fimbria/pilus periplasmic chaperone [Taibaiella sp.]